MVEVTAIFASRSSKVLMLMESVRINIYISPETPQLTSLMRWYGGDFGPDTDSRLRWVLELLEGAEVAGDKVKALRDVLASGNSYKLDWLPYDWTNNGTE